MRSNDGPGLVGDNLKQGVERQRGVDLQRGLCQGAQDGSAALLGGQGFKRVAIKLGIVEGIGCLANIEFHQPRLALRRRMRVPEKSCYNPQRFSLAIADGHAEDRAKSNLESGIHKWKISRWPFDVLDGHAALQREKSCRN